MGVDDQQCGLAVIQVNAFLKELNLPTLTTKSMLYDTGNELI